MLIHIISWDKITLPKKTRGLGLRNLKDMIESCILKLGWKIKSGDKALWCEVIRSKHDRHYN